MKNHVFALVIAVAAAAAGCVGFEHTTTTTAPSAAGVSALMGSWTSATASGLPAPSTCVDFKWNATEQTAASAKGSFSATCAGDLKVAGTAQGVLSGSVITWSAAGTATAPSQPSCTITLTGTAELGANSIRIPYSGDTCLGKVSGVEILNRH